MSKPRSRLALALSGLLVMSVAAGAGCSSSSSQGSGGAGGGKAGSGGSAGQSGGGGHAGAGGAGTGATGGTGAGGAAGAAGAHAGEGGGGAGGSAAGGGGAGGTGAGGTTASGGAAGGAGAVGGGTGGSGGGATGTAGAGGTVVTTCGPGTFGGGETAVTLTSVTAAAVDETGIPVEGQLAIVCGIDLCTAPRTTNASGQVTVPIQLSQKKPALRLGDALAFAQIVVPLTMPATDLTVGGKTLTLGKLSGKPGAALTAGTAAASGDVTLTLAAGTTIAIDTLTYDTADAQKFRSVGIPVAGLAPWLSSVQLGGAPANFSLFYGVAPVETTFCPPVKVTVALPHATTSPNDLGWAPGTAVELWISTGDVGQDYAPYAGWRKMSDGVVSSDGATITTPPGQGFSTLENFAVRKVP